MSSPRSHDVRCTAQSSALPQIDIAIVTYNNVDHIADLLASLAMQVDVDIHVYILDNSPNDATIAAINSVKSQSRLPFSCWASRSDYNRGFGAGINSAVACGTSPWILVLNPDTYVQNPRDLRTLIDQHRAIAHIVGTENIIIGPKIAYPDGTSYPTGRSFPSPIVGSVHAIKTMFSGSGARSYLQPEHKYIAADCASTDWVSGAVFLISRSTFAQLGGFSDRYFMYAEDMDLCWRLHHLGGYVVKYEAVTVIHSGGASTLGSARSITWHHVSLAKFLLQSFTGVQRLSLPIVLSGLFVRYLYVQLRLRIARMRLRIARITQHKHRQNRHHRQNRLNWQRWQTRQHRQRRLSWQNRQSRQRPGKG